MSAKTLVPPPSSAAYQGLVSRVCGLLVVTPPVDTHGDRPQFWLEFDALEAWCKREQLLQNNTTKKDGYEGF